MTAQYPESRLEPLIPMPALTPEALRTAVERLTPSRVPAFVQDLVEATANAQQAQSLAPPAYLRPYLGCLRRRSSATLPAQRDCVTWRR
ncbi:hypothetical protein ACJ6WF_19370 [Streptomyces sp. MMS24-I2-30]|uniref:hypothetical protein n=1 Tax=Streptomyces sp. MMS24-I2-30 TaxID=3351564 RepID=UPI003896B42A